jgi:regulation of enolase protein 1 (concanavalin A-like superfamily)
MISRTTSSGNYNNDATEISQWSGIKAPILNLTSYLVRNSRWFWVNTATINNLVGPMMEVVVPAHPIFTGIKLNAANQVSVVDGTTGTGQTSFIGMTDVGSGTLLAKTGTSAWIVEWQPGKPFYTGSSETPAGKRMLFNAGTQETAPQPQGAFNLTEDGKKMLNNAILYMLGKSVVEGLATDPKPAAGQTDVPFDVTLSWTAGEFAATHDVYVGLSAADVGNASRTAPLGVLASQNQNDSSFAPAGSQFGQTYYWRVDEVDASASKIVKGEVWSFTVEPLAYAIKTVTATASSAQANMGPENTVNGSGLSANDQHSTEASQMWMSAGTQPNWIQYQFDQAYKLTEMWVWNSNQMIETFVGFGAKDVTIEYSEDGVAWTTLAGVPVFAQATGAASYTYNTTVDFGGALAKYVKLTLSASWGGLAQTGLAEVRFFQTPVQAREPQPASGATGVDLNVTLNWRQGREAASHEVYFSSDQNAVTNGTAPAVTVTDHSYSPASLQFGTTYYWKVDEIGAAATPGTQTGAVWSFTSQEYAAIDDFESYNDDDNRIYDTWLDGVVNNNGSIVGYFQAPFAEQTIVHGGKQSMPFEYNNVKTPYFSEIDQAWDKAQNWTSNGATGLSLWIRGNPVRFLDKGNGAFTVSGSGTDIWNAADDFRFVYKRLTGDGSIVVKVDSLVNTNVWAKAGVMIRQSLEAGSPMAYMIQSAASGASFGWRQLAAGTPGSMTQAGIVAPQWVKLTRTGNAFTAQYSADGKTWTDIKNADGTVTSTAITMTGSIYIGLCVTSHDAALTTTAEFSAAAATGGVTGAWQVAEIGVSPQPANIPDTLYVVVQDSAGKSKVVTNPDPAASASAAWQPWRIPLSSFTGVNMASVKKLSIGVGDRTNPKAGGSGHLYIDDIGFGHPAAE